MTGGTVYPMLEVVARGRTDFSMAIAGGLCLCLIDRVCNERIKNEPILLRCFAGSGIITGVEFVIGVLVNLVFKLNVWDYSSLPMNLLGQICLPFSVLWFFATLPAMAICRLFDQSKLLAKQKK